MHYTKEKDHAVCLLEVVKNCFNLKSIYIVKRLKTDILYLVAVYDYG